jgi:hypothetical protein
MLTKTKIAIIAALVAGSATAASAQGFDPNPANRYGHYAGANAQHHYMGQMMGSGAGAASSQRTLQSTPVAQRNRGRAVQQDQYAPSQYAPQYQYGPFQSAPVYLAPGGSWGGQQDELGTDLRDRNSSPYAGGVG